MKYKLTRKAKETLFLYGYILCIFLIGFACGLFAATRPETVGTQDVQQVQTMEAEQTAAEIVQFKEITLQATAYCPCSECCGKCDGITATGTKAAAGRTIAVDPSVIPYGTEVIINGNTYIAEDCGGAIKGNKIDIYFATHQEALNFGRQTVTAYIKA